MAAAATRDRLLDAAEALFFTDGIAVTGVDRVADRAGVAIATLYKHVGSKDGLLEAVLERRLRAWTAHWDAAVAAASSPTGRVLALFDALVDFRASAGATQWCCFLATRSERPPSGSAPDPVQDLVAQDTRLVADRLRTLATEAGVDDPALVASRLLLIYNGALASLLRSAPDDPLVLARDLAEHVVAAAAAAASTTHR